MIETALGWALKKVAKEEVGDDLATAAVVGVAIDAAAFRAMGLPAAGAVAAGAISGAAPKVLKAIRRKEDGK